jgi:hypothetical protein
MKSQNIHYKIEQLSALIECNIFMKFFGGLL